MTDNKELRETIEDISPPENFDTWKEFEKNLKFEFDEKYSSGVEKNARDLWEEMIDREEQTQEELSQDYWEKFDEIEETIEQDKEDIFDEIERDEMFEQNRKEIEQKEQEIEDLEEEIRLGILSLEAEPISKPKRKRKGIIQKVVGFFRGLFR
jgi:hypothetical protein